VVWEDNLVVAPCGLHDGLRQRGSAFGVGRFLGLRPRLVWGAPLALGGCGFDGVWVS
jgi:hypothetical protein